MIRVYKRDKAELQKPILLFLTQNWFLKRNLIDILTYTKNANEKCQFLYQQKVDIYFSELTLAQQKKVAPLIKVGSIDSYAAHFNDVKIIGGSSIIIIDDFNLLYDLKYNSNNKNIDFSDEGICYNKDEICVIINNKSNKVIESGISMTANYDKNFYHFVYEILIKFKEIATLNIDKHVPLLFNKDVLSIIPFLDLINFLNKEKRVIEPLEPLQIYTVKNLYHISCKNIIAPNFIDITKVKSEDNAFDIETLSFLRKKLLALAKPIVGLKKIFIARKKAGQRRNYNEDAVFAVLKKYGFELFYPEEHSIEMQISIFNNADFIIGATGAAFTNILFCNESCTVICLTNYPIKFSIFSTIATFINVQLIYIYDKTLTATNDTYIHKDFKVDVIELENLVKEKLLIMSNTNLPLVTVIVPCYNHEKYIEECLLSVLNQTYKNIQLIVIDDGSKDNSISIIKNLQTKYNFIFETQQNTGVSKTLNKAITKHAAGKYISILASDDYWALNKLEKQINFFEANTKFGLICARAKIVNEQSEVVGDLHPELLNRDFSFNQIALGKSMIPALTVVIKKTIFDKVGLFDENLAIEDLDMWLRIANFYEIGFIEDYVGFYRQHQHNASSNGVIMANARAKILNKWESINPVIFDKMKRNWDLIALADFGKTNRTEALKYYNPSFKNFLNSRYRNFILLNFFKGHF